MKFFNTFFVNSLLLTLAQCGVINKRSSKASLNDFSKYSGISELISANTAKFQNIFKDGPIYSGEGTAYGSATNGGNCLFPKKEYYKDMMYAAINKDQFINDLGCGACALVVSTSNPFKPIRVRIIDQCPECKHGDLDFSDKAFKALTNQSPARVKITWALIPCDLPIPNYPALVQKGSKIKFQFKVGSTAHWTEVQVFNTRYPVAKVELKVNGSFIKLKRRDYNYWYREGNTGFGSGPFDFRVTLADGSVIKATGVKLTIPGDDEGDAYDTGKQTVSGGSVSKTVNNATSNINYAVNYAVNNAVNNNAASYNAASNNAASSNNSNNSNKSNNNINNVIKSIANQPNPSTSKYGANKITQPKIENNKSISNNTPSNNENNLVVNNEPMNMNNGGNNNAYNSNTNNNNANNNYATNYASAPTNFGSNVPTILGTNAPANAVPGTSNQSENTLENSIDDNDLSTSSGRNIYNAWVLVQIITIFIIYF